MAFFPQGDLSHGDALLDVPWFGGGDGGGEGNDIPGDVPGGGGLEPAMVIGPTPAPGYPPVAGGFVSGGNRGYSSDDDEESGKLLFGGGGGRVGRFVFSDCP
jgi:hypothetical protein